MGDEPNSAPASPSVAELGMWPPVEVILGEETATRSELSTNKNVDLPELDQIYSVPETMTKRDWLIYMDQRRITITHLPPKGVENWLQPREVNDLSDRMQWYSGALSVPGTVWWDQHQLDDDLPLPARSWDHLGLPPSVVKRIVMRYGTELSVMQQAILPALLLYENDILLASSFVISSNVYDLFLLVKLSMLRSRPSIQALILVESEAMVPGVALHLRDFSGFLDLPITVIELAGQVLWEHKKSLISAIGHGYPVVIVSCADVVLNIFERGNVSLKQLRYIIVHDIDRFSDQDVENTCKILTQNHARKILSCKPPCTRQVEAIIQEVLPQKALLISLDIFGRIKQAHHDIIFTGGNSKESKLSQILQNGKNIPALVYTSSIEGADQVAHFLETVDWSSAFHYNIQKFCRNRRMNATLPVRQRTVKGFYVLVSNEDTMTTTPCVINYDLPENMSCYAENAGYAGHIFLEGTVINFFDPGADDPDILYDIKLSLSSLPHLLSPFFQSLGPNRSTLVTDHSTTDEKWKRALLTFLVGVTYGLPKVAAYPMHTLTISQLPVDILRYIFSFIQPSNYILASGGLTRATNMCGRTVQLYNPQQGTWVSLPNLQYRVRGHCACCALGCSTVFVTGGFTGASAIDCAYALPITSATLAACEQSSLHELAWYELPPMSTPRCAHASCATPNSVFVFGGTTSCGSGYLDSAEVFDTVKMRWEPLPPMPEPLAGHSATIVPVTLWKHGTEVKDHAIVIAGGQSGRNIYHLSCSMFLVGEGVWRDLPSLPKSRYGHTSYTIMFSPDPVLRNRLLRERGICAEGKVIMCGGGNSPDDSPVEILDLNSNSWEYVPFFENHGISTGRVVTYLDKLNKVVLFGEGDAMYTMNPETMQWALEPNKVPFYRWNLAGCTVTPW
ncbi:kelch-like protein 2/3 [Pelomyxa schiedti]|nr:kelch-like protein 2/3 [Pelomyxa schiedti]